MSQEKIQPRPYLKLPLAGAIFIVGFDMLSKFMRRLNKPLIVRGLIGGLGLGVSCAAAAQLAVGGAGATWIAMPTHSPFRV